MLLKLRTTDIESTSFGLHLPVCIRVPFWFYLQNIVVSALTVGFICVREFHVHLFRILILRSAAGRRGLCRRTRGRAIRFKSLFKLIQMLLKIPYSYPKVTISLQATEGQDS